MNAITPEQRRRRVRWIFAVVIVFGLVAGFAMPYIWR
jgi:hypothetical protein